MIKGKLVLSFYDDESPTIQRGASSYVFDVKGECDAKMEESMSSVIGEITNTMNYLSTAMNEIKLFPEETKQSMISEKLHDCFCLIPMIEERTERFFENEE